MLPAISAECFWGGLINGIECGAEGNATKEGEGSVLDDPAWSIKLTAHEPNDVAAPWTGEFALGHYVQGGDAGDLQLNLTIGHGAGPGPVDLSVTRAGAAVEKARYTCTQLP